MNAVTNVLLLLHGFQKPNGHSVKNNVAKCYCTGQNCKRYCVILYRTCYVMKFTARS